MRRRYAVDGLKRQRLDFPLLRDASGNLSAVSWKEAMAAAADKLGAVSGAEIGVFAGPLVEVEALVALKDLFNKLGSTSTTSCTALSADLRATYTLNCGIAGIEDADALILVGSNPRIEAPLLNARIRKMVRHFGLPVAMVGKPADLTYDCAQLGDGADALSDLLAGSSPFSSVLSRAKNPAIVMGTGALLRPDGGAISSMARQLAKSSGAGYSVLQHNSSAVGALDVGFVPGPTAEPLEKLKVVYLMAADDVPADKVAEDAFVIYQGHHGDAGASMADLILPGSAYTEKTATYVNTEGRVQRTSRAVDPPGRMVGAWQGWSGMVHGRGGVGWCLAGVEWDGAWQGWLTPSHSLSPVHTLSQPHTLSPSHTLSHPLPSPVTPR